MSTINVPVRQRIREQMDRMRPAFTLVYCSEDPNEPPASFKYEQRRFDLPPMKKVQISDIVGVPKNRAYDTSDGTQRPWRGKMPTERYTMAQADAVVDHGISLLWPQGVALLTGDETQDAAEIEAGTARWRTWRQATDEKIVGAFHARMEDFVSDPRNKHLPRPLMGKLERAAQARLDRFRLQEHGVPVNAELRCKAEGCAYWSADAGEMAIHVQASHGGVTSNEMTADALAIEKADAEREARRAERRAKANEAKRLELVRDAAAEEIRAIDRAEAREAGDGEEAQ